MKKVSYFLGAALLLAANCVFVSCDKDNSETPTIDVLINDSRRTTIEVEYNATVKLEITWEAAGKIESIELDRKVNGSGGNVPGFPKKSGFSTDTKDQWKDEAITNPNGETACTITYSAKVIDKNEGEAGAQTKTQDITITFKAKGTVVDTYGDINTVTSVTLASASSANANKSAFTVTGSTFAVAESGASASDFIYFQGSSNGQTLASPENIKGQTTLTYASGEVKKWGTIKTTKLAKLSGVTASDFDGMTNDKLITEKVTSISTQIANQLAAGDIVGFITDDGKKGMIKVISAANNAMNVAIKIQK